MATSIGEGSLRYFNWWGSHFFLGAISFGSVEVPSPKSFTNLLWSYKKLHCKMKESGLWDPQQHKDVYPVTLKDKYVNKLQGWHHP